MKRKIWVMLAFAVIVSMIATFSLAGCKEEAPQEETVEEAAEEVAEEAAEEEIEEEAAVEEEGNFITNGEVKYDLDAEVAGGEDVVMHFWDAHGENPWWEKWSAEYTKIHPNVTFETHLFDFAQSEKLLLALKGGEDVDIFYPHTRWYTSGSIYTEPLTEEMIEFYSKEFNFIEEMRHEGKVYALVPGVMTCGTLINVGIWEEAGLTEADYPKTWDQLVEVAQKLTITDEKGNITRAGFTPFPAGVWETIKAQNGGWVFKENGSLNIDSPSNLAGAQYLYDLVNKYKVTNNGFAFNTSFASGDTAMMCAWTWIDSWLIPNAPDIKWQWINMPTPDGNVDNVPCMGRNNVEMLLSVAANTDDVKKEVGFDIMKYLASNEEAMLEYIKIFGVVPKIPRLIGNPAFEGYGADVISEIIDKTVWPGPTGADFGPNYASLITDKIWANNIEPAIALKEAQEIADFEFGTWTSEWERRYKYADLMSDE